MRILLSESGDLYRLLKLLSSKRNETRRRSTRLGADRRRGAREGGALLEIQRVALGPHRLHRLEAVLDHVAVELDAVSVRIEEIDAARDVVLGGAVERNPHTLELFVGGLQLLEVVQAPGHVMKTGLGLRRRLTGCLLEQRQIVVLLAEAEEHGAALEILVSHLEAQGLRVEVPRFLSVPDVQHDVTESLRLDHGVLPRARRPPAPTASPRIGPTLPRFYPHGATPRSGEPAAITRRSRRSTPARTSGTRSRPNSIASRSG